MPITYPINFPTTFGVSSFSYGLIKSVAVSESPYTFAEQAQENEGEAWDIRANIELLDRDQAEDYNSFLFKLNGRVGTFTMAIPGSEQPRGAVTGTTLVDGGGQTGQDLNVKNLPLSTTNVFRAGDFIQLGSGLNTRLHKILDDVDSDGSGLATLLIAPKIKTAPLNNDVVVTSNPKGIFRLRANLNPVSIQAPNIHSISFRAKEYRNE